MMETRVLTLIKQMEAGQITRNRDFDTFADPRVADAKQRQVRLGTLSRILTHPEIASWQVSLEKEPRYAGAWTLTCRSDKWNYRWCAVLKDFEMEFLWDKPEVRATLEACR